MRGWMASPRFAGFVILVAQLGLLTGIAVKYRWDRQHYPRTWVQAVPVDPDSLTRGRYLQLRVNMPDHNEVVPFYLPEHAADPTRQPDLYVEVTVPPSGPLRPIRLGTLQNGQYVPLPQDP